MRVLYIPATQVGDPPGEPWWIGDVRTLADRTRAWYLLESYGKVTLDYDIGATIVWPAPKLPFPGTTAILPAGVDRVMYLLANSGVVGFKGLNWGAFGSVNVMGSDYAFFAAIHELGHSFGLGHPLTIRGIGETVGGVTTLPPLEVTTGGSVQDLYDVSTSMGYEASFASFNGPQEAQIGWITPLVYSGGDRTITLTALGVPGGGDYVIKIPCTAWRAGSHRTYWLEYRIDTIGQNGVQLHIEGDFLCASPAHIGTMFGAGSTITDGIVTIDVLETKPTEATLRLRDAPTTQPAADEWDALIARMRTLETSLETK